MIGRLVEYEQVGLGYEHIGKSYALLLSAAQLAHRLIEVGNAQLRKYLFGLEYLVRVAVVVEASVEYRLFRVELGLLLKKSHTYILAIYDAARINRFLAREEREECSLARAVLGYESYVLAFAYRKRDVLEQHMCPESLRYILNVK